MFHLFAIVIYINMYYLCLSRA